MRRLFALLTCIGVGLAASAQPGAPELRKMSLEDCLQIALEHNLGVQIARYNPDIARYTLRASYGSYDPTLSLSGEHDYSRSPGGIDEQGRPFGGTETDANVLGGALAGLLPWGLNYSLGANTSDRWGTRPAVQLDRNNPVSFSTNQFFDPVGNQTVTLVTTNYASINTRSPFEVTDATVGFLQLRQPLLKNFWVDSTRMQLYVSKKDVKIQEEGFRDEVMNTVTAVEVAYVNLAYAEENVKVQQTALELAERLLADNRKKVEVGALAPLDEKQAESQAASSRADLLSAEASRDTAQRVLKNLLSDAYTNSWMNVVVVPADQLLAVPQDFNLQESWRRGMAQNPRLVEARLGLEQQAYRVRYQKNQLFPQLDLVGTYGYNASAKEFSGALDQIAQQDNSFYSVGAQITMPLGRTSARNTYRIAKATREQSALQLKQAEQGTLITIENDIATARSTFQRVDATREARLYAEAALDAEQKKLENGKSTSFIVLQLQRDLTTARSAEIRAVADYNIALATLAYDEGSTLERRLISLQYK